MSSQGILLRIYESHPSDSCPVLSISIQGSTYALALSASRILGLHNTVRTLYDKEFTVTTSKEVEYSRNIRVTYTSCHLISRATESFVKPLTS